MMAGERAVLIQTGNCLIPTRLCRDYIDQLVAQLIHLLIYSSNKLLAFKKNLLETSFSNFLSKTCTYFCFIYVLRDVLRIRQLGSGSKRCMNLTFFSL